MSDNKKKRLSMLDNLASPPPAPSSLMKTNRPLRAARDAVDAHRVWDLDPDQIIDSRVADRLDVNDISDLRDSIEATGQAVPILVRRHVTEPDKYHLVYGRRRLEAVRSSVTVQTVRALIANIDEDAAVEAQISENMARRDLTYIEKALFAHELIESGFGNQSRVAEVLTVTKSAISMGLRIVAAIGPDLIRAIGPANGVGRPRWDALCSGLDTTNASTDTLIDVAIHARDMAAIRLTPQDEDSSVQAFEAVLAYVTPVPKAKPKPSQSARPTTPVTGGTMSRTPKGLRIDLGQGGFADWIESQAQDLMTELHARWEQRPKDD